MSNLPNLATLCGRDEGIDPSLLAETLSLLFESSPILHSLLVPQLASYLKGVPPPKTYSHLIDIALVVIRSWGTRDRATFIAGHPRIGETKNLSTMSAKEQGQSGAVIQPTPPDVLARLAHLNTCYEKRYPGLRYIIFVNGRSRKEVAEEMEAQLELAHSLSPDEPALSSIKPIEEDTEEWREELSRAIHDIGCIAKNRLKTFGVEW
jgi:2-oxo-4-hydroxy-4-carboxy--5-ureidoimidazoline (OHCU) decarboxylase